MLAGCGNVESAAQMRHEGGYAMRRWAEKAVPLLHENSEHLSLAQLTKMVQCIPQIEFFPILHSRDEVLPPRRWRNHQSEWNGTLCLHRYQSWSPHRCARMGPACDEKVGVFQGRAGLDRSPL